MDAQSHRRSCVHARVPQRTPLDVALGRLRRGDRQRRLVRRVNLDRLECSFEIGDVGFERVRVAARGDLGSEVGDPEPELAGRHHHRGRRFGPDPPVDLARQVGVGLRDLLRRDQPVEGEQADRLEEAVARDAAALHRLDEGLGGDGLVPDLLRVDERCGIYVAEEAGYVAAYGVAAQLSLVPT